MLMIKQPTIIMLKPGIIPAKLNSQKA